MLLHSKKKEEYILKPGDWFFLMMTMFSGKNWDLLHSSQAGPPRAQDSSGGVFGFPHFLYQIPFQELFLAAINKLEIHGLNSINGFSVSLKVSLEMCYPGLIWQHHGIMRILSSFLLSFLSLVHAFRFKVTTESKKGAGV